MVLLQVGGCCAKNFRNPDSVFAQHVISDDSFGRFLCTYRRHLGLLLSNIIHTRVELFRWEIRIK